VKEDITGKNNIQNEEARPDFNSYSLLKDVYYIILSLIYPSPK
jgi:hypothetical protein